MKARIVRIAAFLTGPTLADNEAAPKNSSDRYQISARRKSDTVTVEATKERTVFVVKSPAGISHASIERLDEGWPKSVVLRLHLKGLEGFQVTNGKVTREAAVSSQEKPPKVRLWKDGKEDDPLTEKSPFWTDILIVGGTFEIALPKAFFEGSPKTITLHWIDFYRD